MAGSCRDNARGGLAAFVLGRIASRVGALERHVRAPRRVLHALISRHGYWGLVIAGLLPLSYWLLCSTAGLLALPYRAYGVLAFMRGPRLLLSYAVVVLAWGGTSSP